MTELQNYLNIQKQSIYDKISADINLKAMDQIVKVDLIKSHLYDPVSLGFQEYYFSILNNEEYYLQATDFFRRFKKQYSLQGIDNNYLDKLEDLKTEILSNIREDNLAQLYFNIFSQAELKHGETFVKKDLGSFFAKLVHTFRPNDYCALDNPIKNYFGLKKESFFISFSLVSCSYKQWSKENGKLINEIRSRFKQGDLKGKFQHNRLSDLKLLDLIFWSKANRQINIG